MAGIPFTTRELNDFYIEFTRGASFTRYEYVDVTFGDAHTDLDIRTALTPDNPEDIHYEVVLRDRPGVVYHDTTADRKPWNKGLILVRSSVTGMRARILLTIKRDSFLGSGLAGDGVYSPVLDDAAFWVSTDASVEFPASVNIGLLNTGFLYITTVAGYATPDGLTSTEATALLNAMVGDSGSGGTKGLAPAPSSGNAAAGYFLKADGTWAKPAGGSATGEATITLTGNQDNVDFSQATLLRCNNSSDLTIRGLVAGTPGQKLTVASVGTGHVFFEPEDTNSTAANRILTHISSGPTPLYKGIGRAMFEYDGTTARWRLITHDQGDWIQYATDYASGFSASDFTGNGSMTWTVASTDVAQISWKLTGKDLMLMFQVATTSVGGTPNNELRWTLPYGYAIETISGTPNPNAQFLRALNNGTAESTGFTSITSDLTYIAFKRPGNANWTASTDNTNILGLFCVPIE